MGEIWTYGAEHWEPEAADDYLRVIDAALRKGAANPGLGSDRSYVLSGLRKIDAARHHAYYLSVDGGIDVIRILHPKMDVQNAIDLRD